MAFLSVVACCIRLFLPLEFLDDLVQFFETLFPDVPITIEPLVNLLQGLGAESVEPLLRARLHLDQAHIPEDLEVLRSLRLSELEPDMDVVHRSRSRAKQLDDPKSIGFAQRGKRFRVHLHILAYTNIRVNEYCQIATAPEKFGTAPAAPVLKGPSNLALADSEMAPQALEKMKSGLGNGAAAQKPVWDSPSVRQ
jgi:hypothetical protein